jgi:hypothetical protein
MRAQLSVFVAMSTTAAIVGLLACSEDPATGTTPGTDSGAAEASNGGSDGGEPLTETLTTFCEETFGHFKTYLAVCCNEDDRATEQYGVVSKTFNQLADDCAGTLTFAAEQGRLAYDADAAQKCMDAFAPLKDEAVCANGVNLNVATVCQGSIRGTQPEGEACRADWECEDGLWCKGAGDTTEGTCAKPVAIGQPCAATGTAADNVAFGFGTKPHCVTGAYCSTATTTAKCAALVDDGDPCTAANQCASAHCYLGKCADEGPVAAGKACLAPIDCSRGLFCQLNEAGTSGTCTARVPEGTDCTFDDRRCKGYCNTPDVSTPGTCASFCGSG